MAGAFIEFKDTVSTGPERLDKWLRDRLTGWSMHRVKKLVADGRVTVNGARAKKGLYVRPGDEVVVQGVPASEPHLPDDSVPFGVAYEDDDILVVEKPAGSATHPLAPDETGTLVSGVLARFPDIRKAGGAKLEPGLLQRLDAGTSGLVMFARNRKAYQFMRREFEMRRVGKFYRAAVKGEMKRDRGKIDLPLAHHAKEPGRMIVVGPDAKFRGKPLKALTRYRVIERKGGRTLVELELITGVTHQLRVHLAHLGHPVIGDDRYGERPDPGSKAFCLQASRLTFVHPRTGEKVDVMVEEPLTL
jgi:23S rRNA pseudouridine1911/1915/1917 synthase